MNASTPITLDPEVIYPESDGKPIAENTLQFQWIMTIEGNLDLLYVNDANVFVAGDLLWYPVQGHPEITTAPDALVAFGRPKGHRRSYLQWREGNIGPQVVWEILSPGNRPAELQEKFEFYERYGVEEYYQYDPDRGTLRGWLRQGDQLIEIESMQGWLSPRLGIRFELVDGELRLYRPDGGRFLSFIELGQLVGQERRQREAAERQAEQERQRREQLERLLRERGIDPGDAFS
jgi:Uma2 family endonuclease